MSAIEERLADTVGGKYRIVRFMAEGGMGSVYEAQHLVVKRRFAVKFLRADLMRRRDALARFKLEAEAAGALESEHIAAAVDFGIARDGAPYIVMEYLDGVDLGRLLSLSGPLPAERAADLVQQACAGAQRAHDTGVLHRDLKPQNLFVCRRNDGTDLLKIVDFGVAKLQAGEASSAVTHTGGLVGTPSYMSPEQARGEAEVDVRTDVYALGVILYELLSGKTPHPGDSYNAVLHHIATQPALPFAAQGRQVPAGLIEVVQRAIAPRAQDRQAAAAELGRELSAFAQRCVWPALVPEEGSESLARGALLIPPAPRSELANGPSGRRKPGALWLLAAASSVAVALLGVSWSASRSVLPRSRQSATDLQPSATAGSAALPTPHLELVTETAAKSQPAVVELPIAGRRDVKLDTAPTRAARASASTRAVPARAAPGRRERRPAPSVSSSDQAPEASGARFDPQNPYD